MDKIIAYVVGALIMILYIISVVMGLRKSPTHTSNSQDKKKD